MRYANKKVSEVWACFTGYRLPVCLEHQGHSASTPASAYFLTEIHSSVPVHTGYAILSVSCYDARRFSPLIDTPPLTGCSYLRRWCAKFGFLCLWHGDAVTSLDQCDCKDITNILVGKERWPSHSKHFVGRWMHGRQNNRSRSSIWIYSGRVLTAPLSKG